MRLICPNCGAQYEVEDAVIPDHGRDVQCSNCGHSWFQQAAHRDAELAEELEDLASGTGPPPQGEAEGDAPDDDDDGAAAKPRGLDPEVAGVLREEAEREAEARRAEADGIETQPDLGLDEAATAAAADRSAAARARMARLRGLEENGAEATAASIIAAGGSRRDLLPDVEEISSSLRASQDRDASEETAVEVETPTEVANRKGSRLLSRLIVVLAILAVVVYLLAPQIVGYLPQSEPFMAAYVDWANGLRAQVNGLIDQGIAWVQGLIGGQSAGE